MRSLPSRNKSLTVAVNKYTEAGIKAFWSCSTLLDFFILFQTASFYTTMFSYLEGCCFFYCIIYNAIGLFRARDITRMSRQPFKKCFWELQESKKYFQLVKVFIVLNKVIHRKKRFCSSREKQINHAVLQKKSIHLKY